MSGAKGSGGKKTGGGAREMTVQVKTGKRTMSQKLWLQRQLNDPYVARAKREGYQIGRAHV